MLVSKKHKKLVLNLREPDRVLGVIPSAKAITYKGRTLVAVPHKEDEVRGLRNIGIDAPAPMAHYYDWPGRYTPFAHQKITAEFMSMNPRSFCLNGMGSGKTMSVLWAYDYLRKLKTVRKMLVISPLSTLERTWGDEIFRNMTGYSFAVVHGAAEKRVKLLESDEFDIYIINHDGLKSSQTMAALSKRTDIDVVVVDEIASFRNASTDRWRALNSYINGNEKKGVRAIPIVWGLTGTPTPNEPIDAWAQIRLISPGRVPKFLGHFRDTVMRQVTQFKWVARDNAVQAVSEVMQPAIRFATEDCIDLPPTTYITRQVDMTPEQKKAFKEMMSNLQADVAAGQITAVNEAVKLGKITQILAGVAYDKDGNTVSIPAGPRIELVKEIIEEAGAKVIVFVPFTGALDMLADALRKDYTVEVVHGGTSKPERDRIFSEFQNTKRPHVLVANAGAMSHGLTLTASDTIIWYAPTTSNETYLQANARIVRPGQKRTTRIVQIESTDIERKMYERLASKGKMQGLLLDLVRG